MSKTKIVSKTFSFLLGFHVNCSHLCEKQPENYICNDQCIPVNLPCNDKCLGGRYLDCDGTCSQFYNFRTEGSWLCNGNCQSWNSPCKGECHNEEWKLNCDGKCFNEQTHFVCDGKCQSVSVPCEERCRLEGWKINCNGQCEETQSVYDCNGACIDIHDVCEEKCHPDKDWKCHKVIVGNKVDQCVAMEDVCTPRMSGLESELIRCPLEMSSENLICREREMIREFLDGHRYIN